MQRVWWLMIFLVVITAILLSVLLTSVPRVAQDAPRYYDCRGCQFKSDNDRANSNDPVWNTLARRDHGYCGRKDGMGCPNWCCS